MKRHGSIRGGFTLVELLVTMGLMALLATVSIAGYYGAVRGMTERGARQDVISFIRMVRQRADIDNVPTAIFFENKMLRDEDEDLGEVKRVVGIAVAVRRAGRLTYAQGNYLSDEFGDLEKTYRTSSGNSSGNNNGKGMWLYRMQDVNASSLNNCRSLVRDYVEYHKLGTTEELFGAGLSDGINSKTLEDGETIINANELGIWTFVRNGGSGNAQWKVGDAYGFEIASMQLPHGYVFGSSVPSQVGVGVDGGKPLFFMPQSSGESKIQGSLPDIRSYRPSKSGTTLKSIGAIKENELRDKANN